MFEIAAVQPGLAAYLLGGGAQCPFERRSRDIGAVLNRGRVQGAHEARHSFGLDTQGTGGCDHKVEAQFVVGCAVHQGVRNRSASALMRSSASSSVNTCGSVPTSSAPSS